MAFQLIQILYWLALATWFGGVFFVAVAAPIVFRTVREANPILPNVLAVNLENQHGTLLAGTIVGNLLSHLSRIHLVCAALLIVTIIGQVFVADLTGPRGLAAVVRGLLVCVATGLVVYDLWVVWPRVVKHRDTYIAHADEPEVANPAKEAFDRDHQLSVTLLLGVLFLLAGVLMFSATIEPASTIITSTAP